MISPTRSKATITRKSASTFSSNISVNMAFEALALLTAVEFVVSMLSYLRSDVRVDNTAAIKSIVSCAVAGTMKNIQHISLFTNGN